MMPITRRRADRHIALGFGLCLACPAAALDLALPIGARETLSQVAEAGSYELPIAGWSEDAGVPSATLDGQVLRKAWRINAAGITTGQVLGPLRDQLVQDGYEIIFECTARSCGGFDFRFGIEVIRAPAMYVDLSDFRFLSARGPDGSSALSLLVSRDGEAVFVQLIVVGPPGRSDVTVSMSTPVAMIVESGQIVEQLETVGHVVLTDVEFSSGSAALGDGPLESLDTIAAYLIANPSRQITFVGHTDATGSLDANIALSKRRAEAARSYVTAKGVTADQVGSDGVGYLSPRASNLTAEGREANRRVEAVLISVE